MNEIPEDHTAPENLSAPVDSSIHEGKAAEGDNRMPPGRGRPWIAHLLFFLGGAALVVFLMVGPLHLLPLGSSPHEDETPAKQLWTCGMHPQVIQDHPGDCPICGMKLVPLAAGAVSPPADSAKTGTSERHILFYRNPMDPTVTSPVPMKDSMGMDYAPVYEDSAGGAGSDDSNGSDGPVVTISPAILQNMNMVTAPVERRDLSREIRTVGYLDFDQEKMVSVTTKFAGFVEKVYVNYVGEPVGRGQPLFEIYAPELVQTQEELISSLAFVRRLADAPEDARQRAQGLVEAARNRLSYWDISADQIRKLVETGQVQRTLTITAPASGLVMERIPGLEGMAVKPGMELFHLADLSTLWLSVEIFEEQLPWLQKDAEASIALSYFPGEVFSGRVRFIAPQVAEKSRTLGLRIEVPNPGGRLRAGMYATVRFQPVLAKNAIVVPAFAVMRTGLRNIVIVSLGNGRFAPREVQLGAAGDREIVVLSGLEPGEEVVTSGQFLIDSESNLREAVQKLLASRQAIPAAPASAKAKG